ncbi:MAG: glutamate--tRNA ligase [Cytophagales bacterium]
MKPVRVRFAPSPTGALHIGGVRTALYNFLLARKHGGTMILRIEDTDQTRYVPGAEDYILESLRWAGIAIDEGAGVGGPHSPYRQSERKEIYQKYALQLLNEGKAYYAFDTEEELEAMRNLLKKEAASAQQYGVATRMRMRNSLTLPADEVKAKINNGEPYVIRLKVPADQTIELTDLIRGDVSVHSSQIDDKVLMKSDGMPTYHLANVVDDYLMQISHVIRGEEWLPSAPLHVLLYESLGWQNAMPQFAHLPLLLKPDGNGKLSKRDADQMGFPIFPLNWKDPNTQEVATGFRESGYLPEALLNFLAFLGWNPGTEQELFSMAQLTEAFSLERIGKAGARFDIHKAQWFNQQYLRAKTNAELSKYLLASLGELGIDCEVDKAEKICQAMRERITLASDIFKNGKFYFYSPNSFDEQFVQKKWNEEAITVLAAYRDELKNLDAITAEKAKLTLEAVCAKLNIGVGKILQALRLAITGQGSGPDLMLTIEIIEPKEAAARLDFALQNITVKK